MDYRAPPIMFTRRPGDYYILGIHLKETCHSLTLISYGLWGFFYGFFVYTGNTTDAGLKRREVTEAILYPKCLKH